MAAGGRRNMAAALLLVGQQMENKECFFDAISLSQVASFSPSLVPLRNGISTTPSLKQDDYKNAHQNKNLRRCIARKFRDSVEVYCSHGESEAKVKIVGAIVERNGKFLMVERLRRSRGYFEFPGGKVEEGETDEHALVRELKEELSVEGKVGTQTRHAKKKF
eukprot:768459-Hanusia_phi.AAC.5